MYMYDNNDQGVPFEPKKICGGNLIDVNDLPPKHGYSLLSMCEDLHMNCTGGAEDSSDYVLWVYNTIKSRVTSWTKGPDWMSEYDNHILALCREVMREYAESSHCHKLAEDTKWYKRQVAEYIHREE